jgi:hypothetical protein
MSVSKHDIIWAFQIILGREPREQAIANYSNATDRTQLVSALLSSQEAIERERGARELRIIPRKSGTGNPVLDRRIILGKSMPRSGHHFLERLLMTYLGSELSYCEMYNEKKCCQLYPCSNPWNRVRKYHFQKSHDWNFTDRVSISTPYVIQYRSPIPRSQSNYELYLKASQKEDNKKTFEQFLKGETEYFVKFHNKWIEKQLENAIIIRYEELTKETELTLKNVIKFIGEDVLNDEKIKLTVASHKEKHNPLNSPKTIRKSQEFRHFDRGLYAEQEMIIKERCPNVNRNIFEYI